MATELARDAVTIPAPRAPHPHRPAPRAAPDVAHDPAQCAAWADQQYIPRGTACEPHWATDAWLAHVDQVRARIRHHARPYQPPVVVPAHQLHAEISGPDAAERTYG